MDPGAALALPGLPTHDQLPAQLPPALALYYLSAGSWQALAEVIQVVLVRRLEGGASWTAVVASCSRQGLPAPRMMQRWLAAYQQANGLGHEPGRPGGDSLSPLP